MEIALILAAGFLLGAFICLALCFSVVFNSQRDQLDYITKTSVDLNQDLQTKIDEFEAIGQKASAANQSWAQAITDFDLKLKDLENRIAMLRMQR